MADKHHERLFCLSGQHIFQRTFFHLQFWSAVGVELFLTIVLRSTLGQSLSNVEIDLAETIEFPVMLGSVQRLERERGKVVGPTNM